LRDLIVIYGHIAVNGSPHSQVDVSSLYQSQKWAQYLLRLLHSREQYLTASIRQVIRQQVPSLCTCPKGIQNLTSHNSLNFNLSGRLLIFLLFLVLAVFFSNFTSMGRLFIPFCLSRSNAAQNLPSAG
jgi:hypothetical protein